MSAVPGGLIDRAYQGFIGRFVYVHSQLAGEIGNFEGINETLARPPGKDAPSQCQREQYESTLRRYEWNLKHKTRFQRHFADWDNFLHCWDVYGCAPQWPTYVERAKAEEIYSHDRPVQPLKSCFKRRTRRSLLFADSAQDPDPERQRAFIARHREPSPHLPAVHRQLRALKAEKGGAQVTVEGTDASDATDSHRSQGAG